MRAARRIFVLAGILALAVFAPITWSPGGRTECTADGGLRSRDHVRQDHVRRLRRDPRELRHPEQPVGATREHDARREQSETPPSAEEDAPPGCDQVEGWPFVLGSDGNVISDPHGSGNMVDPAAADRITDATFPLTDEPGRPARRTATCAPSEVQQDGFAFGTLRCGTDNRNGDNLEYPGLAAIRWSAWPTTSGLR